jgi:hypothetical protein
VVSEVTYLPCLGIAKGIDAVDFTYIFQKDSLCHPMPPGFVYQEIRESVYQVTNLLVKLPGHRPGLPADIPVNVINGHK